MKKNILFCGTPYFATASLISLFQHQYELNYILKGVVTIPDKISGRGQKKQESAIKKEAKKLGLPIFTPYNLLEKEFLNNIDELNLDLIIVVAFKKLPKVFFSKPKLGTINIHASLLPKYRGAAPINWAIINGEKETGLTTFFINENIDTGDIILQEKIKIEEDWHANDLHDALMNKSDKILKQTIYNVLSNSYNRKKQKEINITEQHKKYARKIKKEDFYTDAFFWSKKTLKEIYDFMRGMTPPGMKISITIEKEQAKLYNTNIIVMRVGNYNAIKNLQQKKIKNIYLDTTKKSEIIMTDGLSFFNIEKIKIENGKIISAKDFYNGFLKNKHTIHTISICKEAR